MVGTYSPSAYADVAEAENYNWFTSTRWSKNGYKGTDTEITGSSVPLAGGGGGKCRSTNAGSGFDGSGPGQRPLSRMKVLARLEQ